MERNIAEKTRRRRHGKGRWERKGGDGKGIEEKRRKGTHGKGREEEGRE